MAIIRGSSACPVNALRAWLQAADISARAVFRRIGKGGLTLGGRLTDRSVANIVKEHAIRAGLDPRAFSGHSLRAGFLTSAGQSRCIALQDDGCVQAQVSGYPAGLCAGCRAIPGSRGGGAAVIST